jgi:hypothetical protein
LPSSELVSESFHEMDTLVLYAVILHFLLTTVQLDNAGHLNSNRKFGTVSTPLSQVHLNPKPFVIIRKIDYQKLREDNDHLRHRVANTMNKLNHISKEMYADNKGSWNKNIAKYIEDFKTMIHYGAGPLNVSEQRVTDTVTQLQSERTLQISWTPETINKTKRFAVMPIFAAVMSVAKAVAPTVASSVLTHVSEAISQKGLGKAAQRLTQRKKNYIEVPELPMNITDMHEGYVDYFIDPFPKSYYDYSHHYNIDVLSASLLKHTELVQFTNWELENLNIHRQMQVIRNENFVRDIMSVRNGQVPPSLLPPHELTNILHDITRVADKEKMNLEHIVKTQDAWKIYPYLTPILVMDTNSYEMLLLVIVPMVPAGTHLRLYRIETLPFMTHEGVAMQIVLPQPYYISDITGSHHALLSSTEYDKCSLIDEVTICHIAKPIVTERSACYTALHYGGATDNSIYEACEFKKVDGKQHHFIYLGPNRFAYFLPKPSIMYLSCQGKDFNNMTDLPRSGTLRYEDRCTATVDKRLFYDTSVEVMTTSVTAQKTALSFLTMARGKWPALVSSVEEQNSLLRAANDTLGTTEQMDSLNTRARVYHAVRDLMAMSQEQTYLKEVYNHLFYFITSLAVPIILGLLYSCYHKVFFKCQPKANPPFPKPTLVKFRKLGMRTSPSEEPIVKSSPPSRKRDLPPGTDTPAPTKKMQTSVGVSMMATGQQSMNTYVAAPSVDMTPEQFTATHVYAQLHQRPTYP